MSTAQRNDARVIAVDRHLGDILRTQTLAVLEFNHHYFEDLRDFGPQAQFALSVIYRDAFAVLDALGWHPDPDATTTYVPLTAGHINQLARCRYDLDRTNLDRRCDRAAATDPDIIAEIGGEIRASRTAAQCLDRLLSDYRQAEKAG